MKQIVIKKGSHTIYKWVPDDYVEQPKEIPQRDLTTTACNVISMGMTEEQFNAIFRQEKSPH